MSSDQRDRDNEDYFERWLGIPAKTPRVETRYKEPTGAEWVNARTILAVICFAVFLGYLYL